MIKVLSTIVIYKKITPQPIYYCIDSFTKDPKSSLTLDDYLEMCEASSWHLIDETSIFYIFSSNVPLPSIQSDQELMYDNIFKRMNDSNFILILFGFYATIVYLFIFNNITVRSLVTDTVLFFMLSLIGGGLIIADITSKKSQLRKMYEQTKIGLQVKNTQIKSPIKLWIIVVSIAVLLLLGLVSDLFKNLILFTIMIIAIPDLIVMGFDFLKKIYNKNYKRSRKSKKRIMLISRFIIIVLMLPMVPSYNSILFRPNIKHYIKLPGEAVKDEIYYLNDSTNLKSTWVKEYNDCWVYSEIEDQTEITIETYYHFRFESGADYMFKKLRKRFKYEKTDSEFFGVDEAYGGKNAILVKKDKEVLYLNFPQYFTDDELKKIIDLYIS